MGWKVGIDCVIVWCMKEKCVGGCLSCCLRDQGTLGCVMCILFGRDEVLVNGESWL